MARTIAVVRPDQSQRDGSRKDDIYVADSEQQHVLHTQEATGFPSTFANDRNGPAVSSADSVKPIAQAGKNTTHRKLARPGRSVKPRPASKLGPGCG